MATQSQYNTAIQPYRNISIKLEILDFDYYILDEISGVATSANFAINADSDIRRTCNINMILKDDYSLDPLAKSIYWQSGNPFWFDKYLRINIGIDDILTGETVWNNQGIYLINEPSLTYDATTNELSFEGLDLMADLTGMRNGNLDGVGHEIPIGTNIVSAIKDILLEQNFTEYILNTPPQSTTPYEIKSNAGGTSYDLLSQLRDINSDWEMFFDVNGVFYFQPIANNVTSANEATPFVDADTFKLLHSSAVLDTSFEDVKNYVEVYGKAIETSYVPKSVRIVSDGLLSIEVAESYDPFSFNGTNIYSFTLGSVGAMPTLLTHPITDISFNIDGDIINITLQNPILYDNMSYVFKIYKIVGEFGYNVEYLGYSQPFGLAWDDNEESPFYVGKEITSYNYASPIDNVYNKPKFERQVRIVLSGGEYDNIYSNDLAMQRAKYELYLRSAKHDNIQITLLPIYWMDVNQIIEYQMPNETEPSYWLVKNVNTDFSVNGTQSITAIRYYFNK